ncbi:MAG: hypothetical protein AMXMBFR53_18060 [Gemmatimonadota bacterium]
MTAANPSLPNVLDASEEEIQGRLIRARRSGHPRYVWDDVPMSAWAAACRAIEDAATAVLAPQEGAGPPGPPRLEAGGAATARALAVAAFTSGMGPLLAAWHEAGALDVASELTPVLDAHLAHGRARARRVGALLDGLAGPLARAGLDPVVLKGGHTGCRHFPEAGARPLADVDLFVPASRGDDAEGVLADAGFRLTLRQRRPTRSVWAPPGEEGRLRSLDVTHALNPLTVDLHLSLDRDFYGLRRSPVPDPEPGDLEAIPGLPGVFRGLRAEWLIPVISLHAAEDLSNLQLLRVVELVLVARCESEAADPWPGVVDRTRAWQALPHVFPAWALAERLAPGTVPPAVLEEARSQAPPALRAVVDGLTPGTAQRLHGIRFRERMAGATTPAEKARRLLHMLVPDSAGGSLRRIADLYGARLYQILRGRVRLGAGDDPGPD